ncbi:DoxX family protein [Nonomuraea dietziae]|uniref:DoxX family protein n=1 Tax=Nonomuraea dietziae TaxID=65515 RepID=UPI0033CE9009
MATLTVTGRRADHVVRALRILVALAFLMAAGTKFAAQADAVRSFDEIGFGRWFMYVIACVELAGAIGILIPRLAGPAALGLTALLTGAVVTQLVVFDPVTALIPLAHLVPVAIVAWARRACSSSVTTA